ncbi:hypothetical protein HWV62_17018 [Athelia sp. TMB]|nr:hypothetical protein HWV62_17018 [Athelia sp. TMB]
MTVTSHTSLVNNYTTLSLFLIVNPGAEQAPTALDTGDHNLEASNHGGGEAGEDHDSRVSAQDVGDASLKVSSHNKAGENHGDRAPSPQDAGDHGVTAFSYSDGELGNDCDNQALSPQDTGDAGVVESGHGDSEAGEGHNDQTPPSQDAGDVSMDDSSQGDSEADDEDDRLQSEDSTDTSDMSYQDETGTEGSDEDGVSEYEYTPSEIEDIVIKDKSDEDEVDELQSELDSSPLAKGQQAAPLSTTSKRKQRGPGRRAPVQGRPYTTCNITKSCRTHLTADEIGDNLFRCKKHRLGGARGLQRFRDNKKVCELTAKAAELAAEATKLATSKCVAAMPSSLFAWLIQLWRVDYKNIAAVNGMVVPLRREANLAQP